MDIYRLLKAFLLYFSFNCEINLSKSKKMSFPALKASSFDNLNECERCKVYTDSINHWLLKTSRGKYEGGDAAWEEAKLKLYARSEIRLVEIQEGLCSELKKHQDDCYSLAEEAEQPLEKWWFYEDHDSVDLYTWFCIETLQYCCPKDHFGYLCSLCPLDESNKVCGGHGKCDGEGTRKGNGTCICQRGFTGNNCEHCAKNFYSAMSESCEPCHRACNGCSGEGPDACDACNPGWQLEFGVCLDINECSKLSTCKPYQYCINNEGSYTCKKCDHSCKTCQGPGPSNCTSCETSYTYWSGICVDDKLKNDLVTSAFKRALLYFGLLVITLFIFRSSKLLASIIIVIVAVYIYFSERMSKMNIVNLILNVYS